MIGLNYSPISSGGTPREPAPLWRRMDTGEVHAEGEFLPPHYSSHPEAGCPCGSTEVFRCKGEPHRRRLTAHYLRIPAPEVPGDVNYFTRVRVERVLEGESREVTDDNGAYLGTVALGEWGRWWATRPDPFYGGQELLGLSETAEDAEDAVRRSYR